MIDKPKVSRNDLIEILIKWENNQLSEKEIVDWADQYFPDEIEFEDWEGNDDQSVSNEIMASLDSLGMNLIIKDDIPIYLEFLKTPLGEFEQGYSIWRDKLSKIDIGNRMKLLRGNPVYADFCK
ncbi:hypothetical protein P4C99_22140 [Pontiellaceae bacterium B1224]|nr:hypothetical protein [Pontiellaceae bacterium B1224]